MAANCRYNWESIADFRPPSPFRYQHIPQSEIRSYDRAIAQRTNNATVALHHTPSRNQVAEKDIEKHTLKFGLELIFLPKSIETAKRNSQSTRASVEQLQLQVLKNICTNLECTVDVICFILSSATMARQFISISPMPIGLAAEIDIDDGCSQLDGYLELMHRLAGNWMPKNYAFCHHCLRFLPRLNFDQMTWQTALCCITCRTQGKLDAMIGEYNISGLHVQTRSCHGCQTLNQTADYLGDSYSDSELEEYLHEVWEGPACEEFCCAHISISDDDRVTDLADVAWLDIETV